MVRACVYIMMMMMMMMMLCIHCIHVHNTNTVQKKYLFTYLLIYLLLVDWWYTGGTYFHMT